MPEALVSTEWLAARISRRPTSGWSTRPGSCRAATAARAPSTRPRTFRAPCSSTWTRSASPRSCTRTWCRRPPSSARGCASWAWATATGSWSTTATASSPRPGCGGCSGYMGHDDVMVLDGGLAKWRAEGRPLTDLPTRPQERHFTVRQNTLLLRELDQMRANLTARREQVVDARSAGRFHAREPEPRAGPALGPHPGCEEPALRRAGGRGRHLEAAVRAAPAARGRGRRSWPAGHDQLRLGRLGGADQPRPVRARRAQRGALRRIVGGMGRAGGHARGELITQDGNGTAADSSVRSQSACCRIEHRALLYLQLFDFLRSDCSL